MGKLRLPTCQLETEGWAGLKGELYEALAICWMDKAY